MPPHSPDDALAAAARTLGQRAGAARWRNDPDGLNRHVRQVIRCAPALSDEQAEDIRTALDAREAAKPCPAASHSVASRVPASGRHDQVGAVTEFAADRTADDTREVRANLPGWDLACYCPLDQPCHADMLLRIARKAAA